MNSAQYWSAVQRRLMPAGGVSAIVLLMSMLAVLQQPPTYRASGRLFLPAISEVPIRSNLSPADVPAQTIPATPRLNELREIKEESLQSQALMQAVIDWLTLKDAKGQPPEASELAALLSITTLNNAGVVEVAFSSGNPELSAAIVNAVMALYIKNNIPSTENAVSATPGQGGPKMQILQRAISPNYLLGYSGAIAIGIAGILASIGSFVATVALLEHTAGRVKTAKDLRRFYRCPLLESLPKEEQRNSARITGIALWDKPNSLTAEIYRSLPKKLKFSIKKSADRPAKIVTLVSATATEGLSTVAANLAVATAETQKTTLLVDGNLHNPSQSERWNIPSTANGLNDVLRGSCQGKEVLQQVHSHLWILPAGQRHHTQSLFQLADLQNALGFMGRDFDAIIIDSPPLLATRDALNYGHLSDRVVIVSGLNKVSSSQLTAVREILWRANIKKLALVVTHVDIQQLQQRSAWKVIGKEIWPSRQRKASIFVRALTFARSLRACFQRSKTSAEYTSSSFATEDNSRISPVIQLEAKPNFEIDEAAMININKFESRDL